MIQSQAILVTYSIYVCVCVCVHMCISFSHLDFIFSHLFSLMSMSSKVWVCFSVVNCCIKSTSKCYRMTLAFICPSNVLSFLPSMLMRKVAWLCFFMTKFTLSLWSRSSLFIHHSMDILASSLSWLLSVLGAAGNVGVPVSSIGGFLCIEGLAWVCLMIWLPYFYS